MADTTVSITTSPGRVSNIIDIAYDYSGTVTVTLTAGGAGDYYRFLANPSGNTTSSQIWAGSALSWTLNQPAPGPSQSTITYDCQASDDDINWVDASPPLFTVRRAAIPAPSSLNFSYPSTASSTVTVTMSATGGSGSYEYSSDNSNWSGSNTFTGTRGQTYTRYVRSTYGGSASNSIQNSVLVEFLLPPATITTTAPPSTIAYNAGDQTNQVTAVGSGVPASGVYYRLLRDGATNVGDFNPTTETLPKNVNLLRPSELPPPNTASSYQWQCIRYINFGGDGDYDDCTGTGSSFTITRQNVPAPSTVTPTASTEADANPSISFTSTGGVGVDYNITAGDASVPSTGWGAGPFTVTSDTSATITRGVTYTVWARSNYTYNAVNYTNFIAPTYTVPYLDPQYPSAVFPTAVNVFFGATSFDIDIFNGETSTSDNTFQIRTGSYTGTIVGTGNAILNDTVTITVNDTVGVNLGDTETYYITAYRSTLTGGSGGATVVNVTTFTATTIITTPIVNDSQNLSSTEEEGVIDHTIGMTSLGGGGTLQYAVTASNTYNDQIVRTWQSNPAFTGANGVQRGSPYYFWARRADSATYADSAGPFTFPYLSQVFSVTVSPSSTALIPIADTTDRSIELKAVERNTTQAQYRFRRTNEVGSPVTIDFHTPGTDPNPPRVITISYASGHLPPTGTTRTYYWESQRYTFAGGQTGVWSPSTGTNASFNLTRAAPDTTPDPFNFVLSPAGRVLPNTVVYSNELQITGIDAGYAASASISGGTNPQFRISATPGTSPGVGTWVTSGNVSPNMYVQLRHTSGNSNVTTTSTIDIGGVTDDFVSQAFRMPVYDLGLLRLNGGTAATAPSIPIASAHSAAINITWTATPDSFAQYRLRRLDYDPGNNLNPTSNADQQLTVGASSINLSTTYQPTSGYEGSYRIQIRVPSGQGGNEVWYAAQVTGGTTASFKVRKIKPPVVLGGQSFNKYVSPANGIINHGIQLGNPGTFGTLQYNVSQTASSPSTGWTTSPAMNVQRGLSYYFWARRTDGTIVEADRSTTPELVPYAIQGYGIEIYNSVGTPVITLDSRLIRSVINSGTVAVSAQTTSSYISVAIDTVNNSLVVVTPPAVGAANWPTTTTLFSVETDYVNKRFRVTNNATTSVTYTYFVFRTG